MKIKATLQEKCAEYLTRYTTEQQAVIVNYWETICCTRKTGNISANILYTEMAYWRRFDVDVVRNALQEHIDQRPDYRESYTRGIMRNMQAEKDKGRYKQRTKQYGGTGKRVPKENFNSTPRDLSFLVE